MDIKPIIGIPIGDLPPVEGKSFYGMAPACAEAVQAAGGVPVLFPPGVEESDLARLLDRSDGLLLIGGPDPDPRLFGQEPIPGNGRISPGRDRLEIALITAAIERNMPILGLCRGMQMINVALGGDIYQDLPSQFPGALKHVQEAPRWYPTHGVRFAEGSRLAGIFQAREAAVNSYHHQAVRRLAPGIKATAHAPDGVVEGIERDGEPWVVGVQWHAEDMAVRDAGNHALFLALVNAAAGRPTP